ncbi:hypothetical protein K3172_02310 [Qipengyuania sp. 6B39]|uniref:hypothetical protein n=1 Tax=Qipengyuania proteolytica TaxID=2867239 RepID=UPI001C89E26C|nr:hypothetical protein [Qipengyuania proteolytica]MBX7494686.1 hypothetical protein [Qipengyuania proteolytica]
MSFALKFPTLVSLAAALAVSGCNAPAQPSQEAVETVHCAMMLTYFDEMADRLPSTNPDVARDIKVGAVKAMQKFEALDLPYKREYAARTIEEIKDNPGKGEGYLMHCIKINR